MWQAIKIGTLAFIFLLSLYLSFQHAQVLLNEMTHRPYTVSKVIHKIPVFRTKQVIEFHTLIPGLDIPSLTYLFQIPKGAHFNFDESQTRSNLHYCQYRAFIETLWTKYAQSSRYHIKGTVPSMKLNDIAEKVATKMIYGNIKKREDIRPYLQEGAELCAKENSSCAILASHSMNSDCHSLYNIQVPTFTHFSYDRSFVELGVDHTIKKCLEEKNQFGFSLQVRCPYAAWVVTCGPDTSSYDHMIQSYNPQEKYPITNQCRVKSISEPTGQFREEIIEVKQMTEEAYQAVKNTLLTLIITLLLGYLTFNSIVDNRKSAKKVNVSQRVMNVSIDSQRELSSVPLLKVPSSQSEKTVPVNYSKRTQDTSVLRNVDITSSAKDHHKSNGNGLNVKREQQQMNTVKNTAPQKHAHSVTSSCSSSSSIVQKSHSTTMEKSENPLESSFNQDDVAVVSNISDPVSSTTTFAHSFEKSATTKRNPAVKRPIARNDIKVKKEIIDNTDRMSDDEECETPCDEDKKHDLARNKKSKH